jgi:hypothetical protein
MESSDATVSIQNVALPSGMCCDSVVGPKIAVDDWRFSSSLRTDRE